MAKYVKSGELLRAVKDGRKAALILFFGNWCVDCKKFEPTWDAWTEKRRGPIFMVEIMRGDSEWKDWSLDEIPTLVAFVGGAEVGRIQGVITPEGLDRLWRLVSRGRA